MSLGNIRIKFSFTIKICMYKFAAFGMITLSWWRWWTIKMLRLCWRYDRGGCCAHVNFKRGSATLPRIFNLTNVPAKFAINIHHLMTRVVKQIFNFKSNQRLCNAQRRNFNPKLVLAGTFYLFDPAKNSCGNTAEEKFFTSPTKILSFWW